MTDLDNQLDPETIEWFQGLNEVEQAEFIELLEEAVGERWELAPKQEYAEALWHKVDWMLYGGAAGGGKTELMIKHASDLSERVPTHSTLVVRQSIPELRRSIILRLKARIVQFRIGARLRKVDGVSSFQYLNDSLIECGYLATDEHVANYLSAEYDLILIDEASLMTSNQIILLASRLRTTKRKAAMGARPHLGLFSNPGGASHAWLYEVFVSSTDHGKRVVVLDISQGVEKAQIVRFYEAPIDPNGATDEQLRDVLVPWAENLVVEVDQRNELVVAFVPAKAADNPHIDPTYWKYLNALPERRRRQLRDGDWDTFEGQYFHEWNRDIHIVPWFEIPEGWTHARGLDFGSAAPWACLFGAWDNDGNCYLYDECYGAGFTPAEQARMAKEKQNYPLANGKTRKINYFDSLADPSVFADKRGTGKSIADLWRDNGLHVTRAKNARIAGWQNMRHYLWDEERKTPRLFVLEGRCPNFVRCMPLQQHDKKHPEDLDCFVAGTLVATPTGPRPVETLRVGDMVDTPIGPRPIIHAGVSGTGPTMSVEFTNGTTLRGTPDHCVVTLTRGLVALQDLVSSDILATTTIGENQTWRDQLTKSNTTASSTDATKPASITTRTDRFLPQEACHCTDKSTPTIMDRYLRAGTFITSMAATGTTTRRTSVPSRPTSTPPITLPSVARTPTFSPRTTLGTGPNTGEPYCAPTLAKCASTRHRLRTRARIVASLVREHRLSDSAPTIAGTNTNAPPAIVASAPFVARSSEASTATSSPSRPVHISAVGCYAEPAQVYRLTVDDVGLYYANGILVTNTTLEEHVIDSCRYLLLARPIGTRVPKPKDGLTIEQRFQRTLGRALDRRPRARLFR